MTAKEYLEQYGKLKERIRRLDIEIMTLEAERDSISVDYSGMPHGSKIANKTADLATKLSDKRDKKIKLRDEAVEKRDEIFKVIDRVGNPLHSRLLYDRYILFMTWEKIAEDCDKSDKWCRTGLHSRALRSVQIILDSSLKFRS